MSAAEERLPATLPPMRAVPLEAPWSWLAAGWQDLWQRPAISLGYGLIVVLVGAAITWGLFRLDAIAMVLPLAAGFMLVGPMLAVGLYEASRRRELGLPVTWRDVALVKVASPTQLGLIGGVLAFALLVWWRIASLLFALFWGLDGFPPLDAWIDLLLFTPQGPRFLLRRLANHGVDETPSDLASALSFRVDRARTDASVGTCGSGGAPGSPSSQFLPNTKCISRRSGWPNGRVSYVLASACRMRQ